MTSAFTCSERPVPVRGEIQLQRPPGFERGRCSVFASGNVIAEELGLKLENLTLQALGRAKRIVVDKDNSTIIDGAP